MCGRFYFDVHKIEATKFSEEMKQQMQSLQFSQGEIFPTENVLAFVYENGSITPKVCKWGVQTKNSLLINARSETAKDKYTFKKMKPCAIICNGFYEWKKIGEKKVKYYIYKESATTFYLASLYLNNELVILTKEANGIMQSVHHRMPIMMQEEEMLSYIKGEKEVCGDDEDIIFEDMSSYHQDSLF